MSTELIKKNLNQTLTAKSLKDLVRVKVSEEMLLLIDCSGSMDIKMRNGKKRIEGLREVVKNIRQTIPATKLIAFGGNDSRTGQEAYMTADVPGEAAGGTPLFEAIELAKKSGAGQCVVVSDGAPARPNECIDAARSFGRIDVVYVGDPDDAGEQFLKRLAAASGGTEFHGDMSEPKQLAAKISGLLQPHLSDEDEDE